MRRARFVGIVVILLILAIGPTQALALLPGLGVKAGVNAANVDLDNTSNKTGIRMSDMIFFLPACTDTCHPKN